MLYMSSMNTIEKSKILKEVIIRVARKSLGQNDITDETSLVKDLGFDSVQMVELIVEIESEFDIEIQDDDLDIEKLMIFKSLLDIVKA